MRFGVYLVCLMVISLALASSIEVHEKTIFLGKVYSADYKGELTSFNVKVICNGNEDSTVVSDSTYALNLDYSECKAGDTAYIQVSKDGYVTKQVSGVVRLCEVNNESCASDGLNSFRAFSIINLDLNEKEVYYSHTRMKNFNVPLIYASDNTKEDTTTNQNNVQNDVISNEPTQPEIPEVGQETNEPEGLKSVTGAFLVGGAGSWIAVLILVALIIAVYIFVRRNKAAEKLKESGISTYHPEINHSFY